MKTAQTERTEIDDINQLEDIKKTLRNMADSEAKLRIGAILFTAFLSLTALTIFFGVQLHYVGLVLSFLGIVGISRLWRFVLKRREWLTNRIYDKMLKENELVKSYPWHKWPK